MIVDNRREKEGGGSVGGKNERGMRIGDRKVIYMKGYMYIFTGKSS
jgi:hypothetical protein